MNVQVLTNISLAMSFIIIGSVIGLVMVLIAARMVPKIIDKFTPDLDEAKEIVRGNLAVAEYFGRVVSATIMGISIVIAASILGGILAGLHG